MGSLTMFIMIDRCLSHENTFYSVNSSDSVPFVRTSFHEAHQAFGFLLAPRSGSRLRAFPTVQTLHRLHEEMEEVERLLFAPEDIEEKCRATRLLLSMTSLLWLAVLRYNCSHLPLAIGKNRRVSHPKIFNANLACTHVEAREPYCKLFLIVWRKRGSPSCRHIFHEPHVRFIQITNCFALLYSWHDGILPLHLPITNQIAKSIKFHGKIPTHTLSSSSTAPHS